MTCSPPKFRTDLIVRARRTDAGPGFVVKDPVAGAFFVLREVEHFITQQLDGRTPLDIVRQRTEERFGASLLPDILDAFIRKLDSGGLLQHGTGRTHDREKRKDRVGGSLLYLRFRILDPASFFDRLVRLVPFAFTPHFVVLASATVFLAAGVFVANWETYAADVPRLYQLSTLPLLAVLMFLVVSAHEVAHGVTCRRFGGEVRDVGVMLIYFQPALYCDVSDAWLFPEKSRRLWVSFAGPFFELFLWALATLAWRVTDGETWINHLALVVMTGSGVKTLLNFNPLIKLDGYYLLSDCLDIPNLRRKSFRYVGDLVRRPFGAAGPMAAAAPSRRERRIYVAYGLAAMAGSIVLLAYVGVTVGGFLIDHGQPVTLLLFTGLLGTRIRRRIHSLFGRSTGRSADPDDGDAGAPGTGTSPRAVEPATARKQAWTRISWTPSMRRFAWPAALAAAVALLLFGRMELRIAGPFNARPVDNADVRAAIEGIVEHVYVDEGDQVTAGQPIARLSDKDLRASWLKADAEIRESRARLQILETGPTAQEIAVAKAAVVKAKDQLDYARSRLARFGQLHERGLLSRTDLEAHQQLADTSENTLAEAQARLAALVRSTRPEQIDELKARIEQSDSQRRYFEEQLQLSTVLSPETGVVATPSRELKELRGKLVTKGDLIAKVYDFRTMTAYITISEKDIADIRVGQPVVLKARAYPDVDFHGVVTSIATSAQPGSTAGAGTLSGTASSGVPDVGNKTILVTTQVDNHALLLKPEMTGHAKVFCGDRRILDLMTRRIARTIKVEFWSWW
ncbi:MAG TPA: efflux RND transporter periplasmic adaptor subunit [Vicinamibacterales bacterium]